MMCNTRPLQNLHVTAARPVLIALLLLTLTACVQEADTANAIVPPPNPTPAPAPAPGAGPASVFAPSATDITDNAAFYNSDGYDTTDVIRIDVRTNTTPGTCNATDLSGCTLADVLADTNGSDAFRVDIPVHFQSRDFPDDGTVSNAILSQRGQISRTAPQKSFRMKLDSQEILWRNERRLQLNKHPFDDTRIRNKTAFDLMTGLPHLSSLRTQFVNLWIDDGNGPVDYGLFTHVEFAGKEYLESRNRNKDDNLYKVEFFDFRSSSRNSLQVDETGQPLNTANFESLLEIERGTDHSALSIMLDDFHDPDISFDTVLARYFNENNVLMWLTANLLLSQTDAITKNYYLYNPSGSSRFYFLPWDYDGALQREGVLSNSLQNNEVAKRQFFGYARAVRNKFIAAYLQRPGAHQRILDAAEYLRTNYLTAERIEQIAQRNISAVEAPLSRLPDSQYTRYSADAAGSFSRNVQSIYDVLQNNFQIPIPPGIESRTELDEGMLNLRWTPAYDVTQTNTDFTYEIEVSTSVRFDPGTVFYSQRNITGTGNGADNRLSHTIDFTTLPRTLLFVRLIARGNAFPNRDWQVASNIVQFEGSDWYGMISIDNGTTPIVP